MASPCWPECILFSAFCTAQLVVVSDLKTGTGLDGNGYVGFRNGNTRSCAVAGCEVVLAVGSEDGSPLSSLA